MPTFSPLFAYIGPETLLPMTSVVATIVGFALVLGRNTLRLLLAAAKPLVLRPVRTIVRNETWSILKKPNLLKRPAANAGGIHASTRD
jgi:hypothetical protein